MGDLKNQPIGIRQNNPGNIRVGGSPWLGLLPARNGDAFCRFAAPVWGLRALAALLLVYYRRYNLRTVRELVTRWAPGNENNVEAYVASVCKATSFPPDVPIAVDKALVLMRLLPAIVRHENGRDPYTPELYSDAINLALHPDNSRDQARLLRGEPAGDEASPIACMDGGEGSVS